MGVDYVYQVLRHTQLLRGGTSIHEKYSYMDCSSIRLPPPVLIKRLCVVVSTVSCRTCASTQKVMKKHRKGGQKREHLERSLRREVSVMQMLRHPNVVTLWEVINDPRSKKVRVVPLHRDVCSSQHGVITREHSSSDERPDRPEVVAFAHQPRALILCGCLTREMTNARRYT